MTTTVKTTVKSATVKTATVKSATVKPVAKQNTTKKSVSKVASSKTTGTKTTGSKTTTAKGAGSKTELLAQGARGEKLDERDDVAMRLRRVLVGALEAQFREDALASAEVSNEAIRAYYEANHGRFAAESRVKIWQLVVVAGCFFGFFNSKEEAIKFANRTSK